MTRTLLIAVCGLALAACGTKDVDPATYTCSDFNKSLAAKDDDSAGTYINKLRDEANLGGDEKAGRRAVTLGIYFACRGKPGSTRPSKQAVANAKQIKAGTFKYTAGKKKKSTK
jgi:hypothetical protein